ncbi:invasion protein OrgB [Serratia quinivorans]|uniref:hypothetical protein n=1 Tax=Serratia quinivorans TaxID=137545 RepID=UPI00217A2D79|nr:hypothetical protein [Serratia quinivorans]CAI1905602.1 invasion protein OrgB [Serratia quinivorans]
MSSDNNTQAPELSAKEQVLVKKTTLEINRYQQKIIHYTRSQIKNQLKDIDEKADELYENARCNGYATGIQDLLKHLLVAMENYQQEWHKKIALANEHVAQVLDNLFQDPRLAIIAAEHMANMNTSEPDIELYLPCDQYASFYKKLSTTTNINIKKYDQDNIALRAGDSIIKFIAPYESKQKISSTLLPSKIHQENILLVKKYRLLKETIHNTMLTSEHRENDDY